MGGNSEIFVFFFGIFSNWQPWPNMLARIASLLAQVHTESYATSPTGGNL